MRILSAQVMAITTEKLYYFKKVHLYLGLAP